MNRQMYSKSILRDYRFFLVVLIGILLIVSVWTTSVLWIEPTDLGLAGKLPVVYWIGFALVGILWFAGKDSHYWLFAALVFTFAYLYFAPAIIRATPWISNSYYPFGESLLINSSGHLEYRPTIFVSYHDWPIFLYLASALTLVTGIPNNVLLTYFPVFTVFLYCLLSVLILRTKLKLSWAYVGAAWVLGSFFIRQQYFGPQAIAYVFFLIILLLTIWIFFDDRGNKRSFIGLLLFLSIVTTFTHPLTSLMVVFLIFAVYLTYRLVLGQSVSTLSRLFLLLGAVWFGYNMYVARTFFSTTFEHLSELLFGERELNLYSESSRIVGSTAMELNFLSSWVIVLVGAGIALISVFLIFRALQKNPNDRLMGFSFFMVFSLVLFGIFAFVGEYGAHESYQRAFMFALIPVSYLCVTFLSKKPKLLIVVLVALLFLNIPAQYGADTYRLATDSQLAGSKFIADNSDESFSMLGKFNLYIRYYDPLKRIDVLPLGIDFPYTNYNSTAVVEAIDEALNRSDFIVTSGLQTNFYVYFLGFDPLDEVAFQDKCNLIYDNGRFQIYVPLNFTSQELVN